LPAGSELVERTLREHARLEQLIEAWSMQTPAHEALECFASLLDAHIRFEERELFPFLQAELPAQALQALENMERSGRYDVDSRWDDHFWLDKAIRD
jgi:hemerythrin-like domain-containing protein